MSITRNCNYCQEPYEAQQRYLNRGQGYYCSRKCSGYAIRSNQPKPADNVNCSLCGITFYKNFSKQKSSKSGLFFCTKQHKDLASRLDTGIVSIFPKQYGSGKYSYRERAFREYGRICKECGYATDSRMLDVDHVDSNRKNNSLENLQVLCVWCHALKTRSLWARNS